MVLYAFEAEDAVQLTVLMGEMVRTHARSDGMSGTEEDTPDGWVLVEKESDGATGYVPRNRLRETAAARAPTAPAEGPAHAADATNVEMIFCGDQNDWRWLEGDEQLGGWPLNVADRVPSADKAARLRQVLEATQWWVQAHAHSPRPIREFSPFAIAMALGRMDWMTPEEARAAANPSLAAFVATAQSTRGSGGGGNTVAIAAQEPALAPLLKAALFAPGNPLWRDSFKCATDGGAGTAAAATSAPVVAGAGTSSGFGVGPSVSVNPRANIAALSQKWAAEQPPQSLPTLVFERTRRWATLRARDRIVPGGTVESAAMLQLVTKMVAQGASFPTVLEVLIAQGEDRLKMIFSVAGGNFFVQHGIVCAGYGSNDVRWGEEQKFDRKFSEKWLVCIPSALVTDAEMARTRQAAEDGVMHTVPDKQSCATESHGQINLVLASDAAPKTVDFVCGLARSGIWTGCKFYRSDFVIQAGTHGTDKHATCPKCPVNETHTNRKVTNARGTAALAHFDVPDCGAGEFFINLGDNAHLDDAYGGFCVFAAIAPGDASSFATVDAIAAAVKAGAEPVIRSVMVTAE
eukprot:g6395.t1